MRTTSHSRQDSDGDGVAGAQDEQKVRRVLFGTVRTWELEVAIYVLATLLLGLGVMFIPLFVDLDGFANAVGSFCGFLPTPQQ